MKNFILTILVLFAGVSTHQNLPQNLTLIESSCTKGLVDSDEVLLQLGLNKGVTTFANLESLILDRSLHENNDYGYISTPDTLQIWVQVNGQDDSLCKNKGQSAILKVTFQKEFSRKKIKTAQALDSAYYL